ncbi:MAG: hybrid sensor histidine kinase/response regulator [Campylobacterota bacterium]|nr:hybrid sensor histidine kinase/response regulator [Campylobacterota bacterium]
MSNTILVVDDNIINLDLLINILNSYDVATSLSADNALEVLENESIDLILLDIMMPQMNGYELCELLKNSPKHKDIPIIFLSAKSSHEDITYGFELGAVDYITKPFNPKELLARVKTHLELREYQKLLEEKVSLEVEKNRVNDYMICQQSKQASLGELLMHIAHQWKQPLSELASINLLNIAKIKNSIELTQDDYMKSLESEQHIINFMSNTINTFTDYYQPSESNNKFFIKDNLKEVLSIIDATLNFNRIKVVINDYEDEKIDANFNEISQVIFSILSNAREIFVIKNIEFPKIEITIKNKKLTISDNGGGIDEDILPNIFTSFISTKSSSGIGLYLSKNIIDKNGATIEAYNSNEGAVFKIVFCVYNKNENKIN